MKTCLKSSRTTLSFSGSSRIQWPTSRLHRTLPIATTRSCSMRLANNLNILKCWTTRVQSEREATPPFILNTQRWVTLTRRTSLTRGNRPRKWKRSWRRKNKICNTTKCKTSMTVFWSALITPSTTTRAKTLENIAKTFRPSHLRPHNLIGESKVQL